MKKFCAFFILATLLLFCVPFKAYAGRWVLTYNVSVTNTADGTTTTIQQPLNPYEYPNFRASGRTSASLNVEVTPTLTWVKSYDEDNQVHPLEFKYTVYDRVVTYSLCSWSTPVSIVRPSVQIGLQAPYGNTYVNSNGFEFGDGYNYEQYRRGDTKEGYSQQKIVRIPLSTNTVQLDKIYLSASCRVDPGNADYSEAGAYTEATINPVYDPSPTIVTSSIPRAKVGQPFSFELKAQGGKKGYAWIVETNGLSLDNTKDELPYNVEDVSDDTIRIFGTANTPGLYPLYVYVYDSILNRASKTLQFSVEDTPVKILDSPPPATIGRPYRYELKASGGNGTYHWNVIGQLPPGLYLSPDGVLDGEPEPYSLLAPAFALQVTDGNVYDNRNITNFITTEAIPDPETGDILQAWYGDDNFNFLWSWANIGVPASASTGSSATNSYNSGTSSGGASQNQGFTPSGANPPSGSTGGEWKSAVTQMEAAYAFITFDRMRSGHKGGLAAKSGQGNVAWFVNQGDPYTGAKHKHPVILQAEVKVPTDRLVFKTGTGNSPVQGTEVDLDAVYQQNLAQWQAKIEADFRNSGEFKIGTRQYERQLEFRLKRGPEALLWRYVAKEVENHPSKVGEVMLRKSRFSGLDGNFRDGNFLVCADEAKMRIKGGFKGILRTLYKADYLSAADAAESKIMIERITENLRKNNRLTPEEELQIARTAKVFRLGKKGRTIFKAVGKGLILFQIGTSTYDVYIARDRMRAILKQGGGWAAASAAGTLVGIYGAPLLAAGPAGWLVYGGTELLVGGVAYYIGSHTATYVYDVLINQVPANSLQSFLNE